jgi:hypothetical protein
MEYSVDIFINADNNRWSGVVCEHPNGGGPGVEVYRRTGFSNGDRAEIGCDKFIEKREIHNRVEQTKTAAHP